MQERPGRVSSGDLTPRPPSRSGKGVFKVGRLSHDPQGPCPFSPLRLGEGSGEGFFERASTCTTSPINNRSIIVVVAFAAAPLVADLVRQSVLIQLDAEARPGRHVHKTLP